MVPSQNRTMNIFDSPCSSISSDKQDAVIILDDDSENDQSDNANDSASTFVNKLDINSEILVVKSNLPVRTCRTALPYANLFDVQILMIHNDRMQTSETVTKRQVYLKEPPCSSLNLPLRTRILNSSLSLLGFIFERPSLTLNQNRYLILYDNFTAAYQAHSQLHLCLCQDFRRHLLNIDYQELRAHYQHAFDNQSKTVTYERGRTLRVKKFGHQYHNVRIIDIDCSLIKISFFERKSQPEIWIHSNSSIIEPTAQIPISPPSTPVEDLTTLCPILRKRKENHENKKDTKKIREIEHSDDQTLSSAARSNLVTSYYTNILLPKFRLLNILSYVVHKCDHQCVVKAEEYFLSKQTQINPFLLPFDCNWSIVDSKPRGYRTPCLRTLYSLDEIEQYLYQTQSNLSIKCFIDGVLTRFKPLLDNYDPQFVLIDDLSNGLDNVRIPVFNDLDRDTPDKFTYITKIRPIDHRLAAAFNDTNTTSCCDCTDNCKDRMKCACFRKTFSQARLNEDPLIMDKDKNHYSESYILRTTGYQHKRLLNPISSGIYECNSKCSCHREHCSNRVVQQGLFVHLQLFKDKHKGWGLRTLHDLPRGTFICQYIGELLTSDQGHQRAEIMDDKYQTSLDLVKQIRYEVESDDNNDDEEDSEPYVIDGSLYSNVGKYFNHSCDPNMFIQNVFIESHDLHFPNLALFTRIHVKAGQELTWHYNCELLPDRQVKCLCGAKNCRGRLL